jgi:sporulation protein YlmC with PRC-barrel domain
MAEETEFAIGTKASCSDGPCGEVRRIVIDPAARTVTHLVIEPKHRHEPGRLVPMELIDTTNGEIALRCTIAEFDMLEPAEETDLVQGRAVGTGPGGELPPMGIPKSARVTIQDVVPAGEVEVRHGDPVYALDGEIGEVEGMVVDSDERMTHVLLKEGHLWGRKEVAIPISAVTRVDEGIRLNITKQQVEDLPPVG